MSRVGAVIVALALVSSASAQNIPAKGSAGLLDVATWNVEHFGNESAEPHDDDRQFENVRQVILQSGIDLWALQEIEDDSDFDRLVAELGPGWAGALDRQSTNLRVGFIYKTDIIHLRKRSNILTNSSSDFAGRPPFLIEVDVMLPSDTVVVTFIALHMKCCDDSWDRRNRASMALKNNLDLLHTSSRVIVLGDWNDELTGSITSGRPTPYENFLQDPEDYSFPSFELEQQGKNTFCFSSTCASGSAIDHILITNELFAALGSTDTYDELISALNPYVSSTSDHLPVFAQFDFSLDTHAAILPPSGFDVISISPNPAASRAVAEYEASGAVLIALYDLLGRRLHVLEETLKPAGKHRLTIETGFLAPGVYLIAFQSEGRRITRPLVITR